MEKTQIRKHMFNDWTRENGGLVKYHSYFVNSYDELRTHDLLWRPAINIRDNCKKRLGLW